MRMTLQASQHPLACCWSQLALLDSAVAREVAGQCHTVRVAYFLRRLETHFGTHTIFDGGDDEKNAHG